jgi:hypothetical protein
MAPHPISQAEAPVHNGCVTSTIGSTAWNIHRLEAGPAHWLGHD